MRYTIGTVILLLIVGYCGSAYAAPTMQNDSESIILPACTMEAKICPDGSAVGRTGPNCEFALCPGQ